MRTLAAALTTAQQSLSLYPKVKITFSKTGETDIVVEEDKILTMPSEDESTDSQTAVVVFDNSDGYFTTLDLKGWSAVIEMGLKAPVNALYSTFPPFKVVTQELSSAPAYLQCRISMIGIPNRLAEDRASKDYFNHWSSTTTVKDMVTEIASGVAVTEELTEKQDSSNGYINLDGTGTDPLDAVGQRVSIPNRLVTKVSFRLKKTGLPAGTNVTFIIRDVETNDILASKVFPIASIGSDPVWCEATFTTPVQIDKEITYDASNNPVGGVWIYCLYQDGGASNYVSVSYNTIAIEPKAWITYIYLAAGVVELSNEDCAYRYKYTATGIDCFTHCQSYDVVYDSEDSLIDTYCPADAFKIYESNSRLDAINRLLQYTGCEKRAEDDGKIHVLVPVVSGTTYDSQYSLESGHVFFSKGIRNALVIPNKITVHSYTDDTVQYTGYYTDATSFALLPISNFVKAKLISSAQATSIATAMISRLQVAAQRGSASVPINLGAEVFDYVKVTDSIENDTRVGNIGSIHRSFNPKATWPDCWNMDFSFGQVSTKGVAGTKLSLLTDRQIKPEPTLDEQVLRWGMIKPTLDIIERNFESAWKQFDDIINLVNKLVAFLNFTEDADPTETQILAALLGYIRNIVEDTTPQLGGTLDAQAHTISNLAAMRAVTNILLQIGTTSKFTVTDTANDSFNPLDMNSNKITALATPTDDTDGATKNYVDTRIIPMTPSDVTSSRAVDTTYTNSTGKPILVMVTLELLNGDYATGLVHASADPPTIAMGQVLNNDPDYETREQLTFIVPNGWKYRVTGSGTPTKNYWAETQIG
jgi:hypothetical protein